MKGTTRKTRLPGIITLPAVMFTNDDELCEWLETQDGTDECFVPDGYAPAFVGVHYDSSGLARLVYSENRIIALLAQDMGEEGAREFFDFNVAGAYVGRQTPMYIRTP